MCSSSSDGDESGNIFARYDVVVRTEMDHGKQTIASSIYKSVKPKQYQAIPAQVCISTFARRPFTSSIHNAHSSLGMLSTPYMQSTTRNPPYMPFPGSQPHPSCVARDHNITPSKQVLASRTRSVATQLNIQQHCPSTQSLSTSPATPQSCPLDSHAFCRPPHKQPPSSSSSAPLSNS